MNKKPNIIDLIAVVLIIIAGIGAYARLQWDIGRVVTDSSDVTYSVKVFAVRKYTVDALMKKGPLLDMANYKEYGEIVDVTFEPAKHLSTKADGSFIESYLPERYDCIVKVKAKAKIGATSTINNINSELFVGAQHPLSTKNVVTSGQIILIQF